MSISAKQILVDGLWHNNQSLVAFLGLCPLLAVSNSMINALGLGLATTTALMATNLVISLLRKLIPHEIRIPVFVIIIATVVTIIELVMQAYVHSLYRVLGIFVPLIVTNCSVMARAEAFAYKQRVGHSLLDGLAVGSGFTLVLVVLGAIREVLGYGTLFRQADLMFGPAAAHWTITIGEHYHGFLLAILPAGAFFGLSILVVLRNAFVAWRKRVAANSALQPVAVQ